MKALRALHSAHTNTLLLSRTIESPEPRPHPHWVPESPASGPALRASPAPTSVAVDVAVLKASLARVCCCRSYETRTTHEGLRHWPVSPRGHGCSRQGRRVSARVCIGTAAELPAPCPIHPAGVPETQTPLHLLRWFGRLQTRRWGFQSCPRAGSNFPSPRCLAGGRGGAGT